VWRSWVAVYGRPGAYFDAFEHLPENTGDQAFEDIAVETQRLSYFSPGARDALALFFVPASNFEDRPPWPEVLLPVSKSHRPPTVRAVKHCHKIRALGLRISRYQCCA